MESKIESNLQPKKTNRIWTILGVLFVIISMGRVLSPYIKSQLSAIKDARLLQ